MKKIYLMTAAFALLSMTASAQSMKRISKDVLKNVAQTQAAMRAAAKTGARVGSRAGNALEDNQRYINYSCNENLVWPSSFPDRGTGISLGTIYFNDVFKKFEGCKIVGARFYLNRSIGNSKMTICKITEDGSVTDALLSKDVPSTDFGWNYVWFDDSYELKDGDFYGLLPYYDFYPANLPADAGYPIGSSGTWVGQYGYLAYGDIEENQKDPSEWMWNPLIVGYTTSADGTTVEGSNLMLQLIIEKQDGTFILHDIVMDDVAMAPFSKLGGQQAVAFTCHNDGRDDITNAEFAVDLDGERFATFNYKSYAYDSNSQYPNITDADFANVPFAMPIDEKMASGEHEISVYPISVEGKDPEGDLTNDKVSTKFKVFGENFDRTMNLLEYFSNQNSQYSYFGNENLNALETARNKDKDLKVEKSDVAIVDIHGESQDGDNVLSDQFAIDDAKKVSFYTTSAPASISINRYFYKSDVVNVENELGINIAAESSQQAKILEVLGQVIDQSKNLYPSFSTVGIESELDGNKLTIKVKGKLVKDYEKLIGDDARLTVYLTEDGLRGKQMTGTSSSKPRYTFNNVLRKIVTGNLGDALQVHGNTYENDYEVELDNAWKASKMHIVAFVSRPMKEKEEDGKTALASELTDLWVDNTNMVDVGSSDLTSISQIIDWQDAKEVGRYTIDGQKLSAPMKGVNLVKLSNGKTIKVIVK